MNRKCQQHKYNECEFVYLKPTTKNVLICSQCVDKSNGKIKMIDCVGLKHILEGNSKTILQKYPPLSSYEINQRVLHISSSIDGEIRQIKEYFKKLILSFKDAVRKAMAKSKAQIDQLQQLRESFIKQYSEVAEIDKLKQLVVQSQKDQNLDNQLISFIETKQKEATANTKLIMAQMKELQQYKESLSVEQPERQESSILQEIEEIKFFNKTTTNKSSSGLILPIQNTQRRSIINSITINPSSNIENSKEDLEIQRINNQIHIKVSDSSGQCTFESVLNPKKKYILSIQTIIGDKNDPSPWFFFGIMPFSLRNYKQVRDTDICYNETSDCDGISKMLKGDKLHFGEDYKEDMNNYWRQNGERRFEVRVNLENQIFKVGSLPDYKLVAEIDKKEKIDLSTQYTFAINCIGIGNRIIVENICEIDFFDDLM